MKKLLLTLALCTSSVCYADNNSLELATHYLPDVNHADIKDVVNSAILSQTNDITAELLIAIAWGESRLKSNVKTGNFCGIVQVNPADIGRPKSDCNIWLQNSKDGFAAAVTELQMMLSDKRVNGSIKKALMYRACGNSYFAGKCKKISWANWVLYRAAYLKNNQALSGFSLLFQNLLYQ